MEQSVLREKAKKLLEEFDVKYRRVPDDDVLLCDSGCTSSEVADDLRAQIKLRAKGRFEVVATAFPSYDDVNDRHDDDYYGGTEYDADFEAFDREISALLNSQRCVWVVPKGDPRYDSNTLSILFSD